MNRSPVFVAALLALVAACAAENTPSSRRGGGSVWPVDGGRADMPGTDGGGNESCPPGIERECYPGNPADLRPGADCQPGSQACEGAGEFGTWGECLGATTPAGPDVCGDARDTDCDGLDCPGDGPPDAGVGDDAGDAPGTDAGGADIIDSTISIYGDCTTASCPPDHPYPVGCSFAIFGGGSGEARGCIASTPTNPVVYFQAGDSCELGYISGTLRCSTAPGAPLDQTNCPIPKPTPYHVTDPSGCPEITD